jgi:hypothetical protein
LGDRLVYKLKILLGYQKILNPRGAQKLEGRRRQKK